MAVVVRDRADNRGSVGGVGGRGLGLDDSAPVAAEFIGKARAARQAFHASIAVSPLMQAIATYAVGQYASRRGAVSPRVLDFTEARWRKLPNHGLIIQSIEHTAKVLSIRDCRAVDTTLSRDAWDADEPGIALHDNRLRLERRRVLGDSGAVCVLSLHSLARWHQRQLGGVGGGIVALTKDLAVLADAAPDLIAAVQTKPEFHVETSSGAWHGHIAHDGKRLWANVRTFY